MVDISYLILIACFIFYYLLVLFIERRFISDPREIIEKIFSITLLFAGISIVYYSFTGKTLMSESIAEYNFYIMLIGIIAIFWTLPSLLEEFSRIKKFLTKTRKVFKK